MQQLAVSRDLNSISPCCDRYFIGRSAFVEDVLSMIQSSTYDGRQDREMERH